MLTAGIDLSTEPAKTALAVIEWSATGAALTSLALRNSDAALVDAAGRVTVVGIDCPFGWPDDFVDFLAAHRSGTVAVPTGESGTEWRRRLAYRETDRFVQAATGLRPLSVAADRIGLTAMRVAGLLAQLDHLDRAVDRAGGGVVVEVYPAASLTRWGLSHQRYKGADHRSERRQLICDLVMSAPWLDLGEHEPLCADSDDALDAVVAALTARAVALGQSSRPDAAVRDRAAREGWIALPTGPLADLAPAGHQSEPPGGGNEGSSVPREGVPHE